MKTGLMLIAEERARQVSEEGWTHEHDDQHCWGELAIAGACYAAGKEHVHVQRQINSDRGIDGDYDFTSPCADEITWPFEAEWYKPPDDRVRELVKAGALIAAEIDRLQRKEETK